MGGLVGRFYAEIKGNRGLASRMGTANSGMWAHIRGWDVGIKVVCGTSGDGTDDTITQYATSGSGTGGGDDRFIGRLVQTDTGYRWIPEVGFGEE